MSAETGVTAPPTEASAAAMAEVLVPGAGGRAPALVLDGPISFWGGVDAATGRIADVRHPQLGAHIAGTVLFLPGTIGSSSASAVLLELVHNGHAPAALVLHEPDAILLLGLIVAREMGWPTPVAVRLARERHDAFRGCMMAVGAATEAGARVALRIATDTTSG
jgi:predicted aconitase with swiveling domain